MKILRNFKVVWLTKLRKLGLQPTFYCSVYFVSLMVFFVFFVFFLGGGEGGTKVANYVWATRFQLVAGLLPSAK